MFDLRGKVAIVTGGVSGIGYECAKELLRSGLKAVSALDVNDTLGKEVAEQFFKEFGRDKFLFLKVDVRDKRQFEDAFLTTADKFGSIDILINNAGILNDGEWEDEIDINIKGTVNGTLLGLETYLPKYKSGDEALIINISSIVALETNPCIPIYAGTKAAVLILSRSFGAEEHYQRTNVRIVTTCIGGTWTPLGMEATNKLLSPVYVDLFIKHLSMSPIQMVDSVASGLVKVAKEGKAGSVWVLEGGEAYEIEFDIRTGKHKL